MAAKIFNVPEEIKVPEMNFISFNRNEYEKEIEEFEKKLIQHLNKLGYNEDYVGEIISFPVADGSAQYMVFNLKPVMLIHLPIGDAWEFQYAHLLTKTEVIKKINQRKALSRLFGKKK